MKKNKHFWKNTKERRTQEHQTGRRGFKRDVAQTRDSPVCKAALTKVSSTDEMQAGMNIPTFVFNPWIPDTVIRTTCIFLDNSSSIK